MTTRALLAAAALLALGFAGCLGGGGSSDGDADPAAGPGPGGPVAAPPPTGDDVETKRVQPTKKGPAVEVLTAANVPTWQPGRWWEYTLFERVNETADANRTFKLVVLDDAGPYRVGTDSRDLAYQDRLTRDVFYVGEFQKGDLAPLMRGAPAPFVKWPLRDGSTWSYADAEGRSVAYRAAYAPALAVGATTYQGFVVSGTYNGTVLYEFSYIPEAKFFVSFEAFDPDLDSENNRVWKLELTEFGEAFDGEAIELQTQWLFKKKFSLPTDTKSYPVSVPDGLSSVFVFMELRSGDAWSGVQGTSNATLLGPDGLVRMWHYRFMVVPYIWDNQATVTRSAFCTPPPQAAPLKDALQTGCFKPLSENYFRPYQANHTATFEPAAGEWTLLYTSVGTNELRASIGVAAIVETAVTP